MKFNMFMIILDVILLFFIALLVASDKYKNVTLETVVLVGLSVLAVYVAFDALDRIEKMKTRKGVESEANKS